VCITRLVVCHAHNCLSPPHPPELAKEHQAAVAAAAAVLVGIDAAFVAVILLAAPVNRAAVQTAGHGAT